MENLNQLDNNRLETCTMSGVLYDLLPNYKIDSYDQLSSIHGY